MNEIDRTKIGYIPELEDCFDPGLKGFRYGLKVKGFWEKAEITGVYRIKVYLIAKEDVKECFLFAGRKNLFYVGCLKAGEELKRSFYIHVGEIIPRYHHDVKRTEQVSITIACDNFEKIEILKIDVLRISEEAEVPMVFIAGDSTVTDQISEMPYHPGGCYSSWGQDLSYYIGDCAAVDNQAHCGLSTESFREEGHFSIIQKAIKPGDYCLFQFAHNDQKLAHLQAKTGYRHNLLRFIHEIMEKGGLPVLVTPLGRNLWTGKEGYLDLLNEYAHEVNIIGEEMETPVIQLHDFSVAWMREQGYLRNSAYFHPGDVTHTNEYGAYLFAGFVAAGLQKIAGDKLLIDKGHSLTFDFVPDHFQLDSCRIENENRNKTAEHREQFDAMEKSVENLILSVNKAKIEAESLM